MSNPNVAADAATVKALVEVQARAKAVKPPLWLVPPMRLFPIRHAMKAPPCFDGNLALASDDKRRIAQWAAYYRGCNWGVALGPSHLIVVDVDTRAGKVGAASLDYLELEHGRLPRTLTVRSPSGGIHYYFTEANGVMHVQAQNAFGQDLDSPGYTVAPGSVLLPYPGVPKGGSYDVIVNAPIAPAPAWMAEYLVLAAIGDNSQVPIVEQDTPDLIKWAIYYLTHDAPPSIQGRNGEFTLLMVAVTLKDNGISEHKAVELLDEYYNVPGRCEPQWSRGDDGPDSLDVKAHNAFFYLTQNSPGSATADADFGDDTAEIYAATSFMKKPTRQIVHYPRRVPKEYLK